MIHVCARRVDKYGEFRHTSAMRRCVRLLMFTCAILVATPSHPAAEVVIAIRYLQPKGVSRAHLYLYADRGKLLRQLTKENSGQDFDPLFAPDGKTIVFSRELSAEAVETWSIKPDGTALKRLEAPPDWYVATRSSPYFANFEPEAEMEEAASPEPSPAEGEEDPPRTFRAPDHSVEVVVRRFPNDEADSVNGEGTGRHFLLRDLKAGSEVEMGTLPGFLGLWEVLNLKGSGTNYLFEGELRTIFFALHLDSTDGDTVFALDLPRSRIVRLSRTGRRQSRCPVNQRS